MAKFGDLLSELRRDIQLREQRPLSRCRKTYTVGELF